MARRTGKWTAIGLAAGAILVAALALHRPFEDAWLIHVLRTGDRAAKEGAAARLAEHECWRAVPDLLEAAAGSKEQEGPLMQALFRLARPAALPYLRGALQHRDAAVRALCLDVLRKVEPFDRETVRILAIGIEDGTLVVWSRAGMALRELGPLAREAEPALRKRLSASAAEDFRTSRMKVLAACGRLEVSEVKNLYSSDRPDSRNDAVLLLQEMHPAPWISVPFLGGALHDEDAAVRLRATKALAELARDRDDALRLLVESLRSTQSPAIEDAIVEAGERAAAALGPMIASSAAELRPAERSLLARIWRKAGVLRPEVLASLEDRGPLELGEAILLCADLGASARGAVPSLERLLDAKETSIRLAATVALARVAPEIKVSMAWLEEPLDALTRMDLVPSGVDHAEGLIDLLLRAWLSEGELHVAADRVLAHAGPALIKPLLDAEEIPINAKRRFVESEGKSLAWPDGIVPWAVEKLSDRELKDLARAVLERVTSGGAAAAAAARRLADGSSGGGDPDMFLGFEVLLHLGEAADPVLAEVLSTAPVNAWTGFFSAMRTHQRTLTGAALHECVRALREGEWSVRMLVSVMLMQQQRGAAEVVPALLDAMLQRDHREALLYARALGKLGTAAVPALASALSDRREHVRCLAAFALGRVGGDAAPALPALEAALKDSSDLVRGAAEDAIRAVREWTPEGPVNQDVPR